MDHSLDIPSALPMPAGTWQWNVHRKCSWQEEMGGQRSRRMKKESAQGSQTSIQDPHPSVRALAFQGPL